MAIDYFAEKPQVWPEALYNGAVMTGSRKLPSGGGYQVTFSHPVSDLGRGDVGGPWLMEKSVYTYVFGHFQNKNPLLGYNGPTLPWDNNSFGIPLVGAAPTDASYDADGARAIAATEPTNPIFDAATSLGDCINEGLLTRGGTAVEYWIPTVRRARAAGNDYLKYQFGWVPFVSDLNDFKYAVSNSDTILKNLRAHENVPIRRRLILTDTLDQQTEVRTDFIRTFGLKSIGSDTTYYNSSLRERKWFSGCYRIHLPIDNSIASRFKRYRLENRKLYGIDLTPETVWNIAPWSWAVDWHSDIGDILHNFSALGHNGLVLQYGYIMHEVTASWQSTSKHGTSSHSFVRKRRVAANPYGFGVTTDMLNPSQLAVLAALGLSRTNVDRIIT